jgi:hypothetical protein
MADRAAQHEECVNRHPHLEGPARRNVRHPREHCSTSQPSDLLQWCCRVRCGPPRSVGLLLDCAADRVFGALRRRRGRSADEDATARRRAVAHLPSLLECPSISPSGSTADSARRSIGYRRTVCSSSAQARTLWCGTLQRCELAGGMRAGGRPRESTPRESSESIGLMMSTASHLRLQRANQHSREGSATLSCLARTKHRGEIQWRLGVRLHQPACVRRACARACVCACAPMCARARVRARVCARVRARVCACVGTRECARVCARACVCV